MSSQPCKGCGEPTPFEDGYCETCVPVEYGGLPKQRNEAEKKQKWHDSLTEEDA